METPRFTVGQVASMTGISSQTLRYYDKIGIFKPLLSNPGNNYRYYAPHQLMALNVISSLKDTGLSLSEIKACLMHDDLHLVLSLLTRQKAKIRQQIEELEYREKKLADEIKNITLGINHSSESLIEIKDLPDRLVAYTHVCAARNVDSIIIKINELVETAKRNRWTLVGRPILSHCNWGEDPSGQEDLLDVCMRVMADPAASGNLKTIPGGTYASLYHRGPYENFDESCNLIYQWIERNGWQAAGKPLITLIIDVAMTRNPANLLSEVQIPVKAT